MPPYWVQTDKAKSAIVPRPRGSGWLDADIASLRADGIDVLVSGLSAEETDELLLADEAESCRQRGIEVISFPIIDRGLPTSREAFAALIEKLSERVDQGKSVGAHCRAGIGRSSVIIASLLIRRGLTADAAFDLISSARGFPVPDTPEQRAWVRANAVGPK
jgi:protein-tyrosine phosphatase